MSFGRLSRPTSTAPMSEINMTPLIDVMLVLLIIFMVAAPLMGAALKLDLPRAGSAAPAAATPFQLQLDAQGQAFWNGEALAAEALRERLLKLGREQPEAELQLAIDQAVPYGLVAGLLDAMQAAGLSRVAFATSPTSPTAPAPGASQPA